MRTRSRARFSLFSALVGAALPLCSACGQDAGGPTPEEESSALARATKRTDFPDAEPLPGQDKCEVVEFSNIAVQTAKHIDICTAIKYPTNPPAGGSHWPAWAFYNKYDKPVPREMYVHNLEHGGAVITYRCEDACPEVKAALEDVFANVADSLCAAQNPPSARVVLTPDPEIPTPIAVSTWRATYTATCLDKPSLKGFIDRNLGAAPELVCGGGVDPETITARCAGGG